MTIGSSHGTFPESRRAVSCAPVIEKELPQSLTIQLLLDRVCNLVDRLRAGHCLLHASHDRGGGGSESRAEVRRCERRYNADSEAPVNRCIELRGEFLIGRSGKRRKRRSRTKRVNLDRLRRRCEILDECPCRFFLRAIGKDHQLMAAFERIRLSARPHRLGRHTPMTVEIRVRHLVDALDHALQEHLIPDESYFVLCRKWTKFTNLATRIDVTVFGEIAHPCEIALHLRRIGSTFARRERCCAEGCHPWPVRLQ